MQAAETTGESRGRVADDHLAARGPSAEARCHVEGGTAEASVLQLHRLPGVDAHSHSERNVKLEGGLLELRLEVDGRTDRLAGGCEDDERLVPAHLHELAVVGLDVVGDDGREPLRQRRGSLVAALLRVARIPPDVGDQEGADACLFRFGHAFQYALCGDFVRN